MLSAPSTARPETPSPRSTAGPSAWDPYLSISRPFVTLRVGLIPNRGYILTLTDSTGRTVSTPTVALYDLYRVFEGHPVTVRSGGFAVEFLPVDGVLDIKGGPLAGVMLKGTFAPEVLKAAVHGAREA